MQVISTPTLILVRTLLEKRKADPKSEIVFAPEEATQTTSGLSPTGDIDWIGLEVNVFG